MSDMRRFVHGQFPETPSSASSKEGIGYHNTGDAGAGVAARGGAVGQASVPADVEDISVLRYGTNCVLNIHVRSIFALLTSCHRNNESYLLPLDAGPLHFR